MALVTTNFPMKDLRSKHRILFLSFPVVKDAVVLCALDGTTDIGNRLFETSYTVCQPHTKLNHDDATMLMIVMVVV